jgi:hypothetical protein
MEKESRIDFGKARRIYRTGQSLSEENTMNVRKITTVLIHAFVGWALCAATIGIGLAITSVDNALIAHAIGAPIFFMIVSLLYFKKFNYTTPLQTAMVFVGFAICLDFFVVALLINKSLAMFASLLGTWIPFVLIFVSTYLTGVCAGRSSEPKAVA